MAQVEPVHFRLTAADLGVPSSFESLETSRDASRIAGQYNAAAKSQRELEKRKLEEDMKHLQMLADKHEVEAMGLQASQDSEYAEFVKKWDTNLSDLAHQAQVQQQALVDRHQRELDAFKRNAEASVPKPKWSRDLLNQRKIEEHLVRQREFEKAAAVKGKADMIETYETQQNLDAYWAKMSMEEGKLAMKQSKELDGLNRRTKALHDEAIVTQRRDLDKMTKKFQVARIEMSKVHAMEKIDLEAASRGYFNPKKFGLGPSPLVPPGPVKISLMSPASKLSFNRSYQTEQSLSRRNSLGQIKMMRSGDSSPSATPTASKTNISDDWPTDGGIPAAYPQKDGPSGPNSPTPGSKSRNSLLPNIHSSGLKVSTPLEGPGSAYAKNAKSPMSPKPKGKIVA